MKLIIKRDQAKKMMGGISFELQAKVECNAPQISDR